MICVRLEVKHNNVDEAGLDNTIESVALTLDILQDTSRGSQYFSIAACLYRSVENVKTVKR